MINSQPTDQKLRNTIFCLFRLFYRQVYRGSMLGSTGVMHGSHKSLSPRVQMAEYALFIEEFKKTPGRMWIMKPVGSAQVRNYPLFKSPLLPIYAGGLIMSINSRIQTGQRNILS